MSMPRLFIVFLNAWRSSPRSMASTLTPMTLTPYLSSTPALGQLGGEVQPGLAAEVGQQGVRPLALMISVTAASVSGSM